MQEVRKNHTAITASGSEDETNLEIASWSRIKVECRRHTGIATAGSKSPYHRRRWREGYRRHRHPRAEAAPGDAPREANAAQVPRFSANHEPTRCYFAARPMNASCDCGSLAGGRRISSRPPASHSAVLAATPAEASCNHHNDILAFSKKYRGPAISRLDTGISDPSTIWWKTSHPVCRGARARTSICRRD